MLNDSSEVKTWKWYSLSHQCWLFSPVDDVGTIAFILFDTIMVVVTLVGTLGTWRVYKRSAWKRLTLTCLLAEQSMCLFLLQDNSHNQSSGLMRFGYFSHIYPVDTSWSLTDLCWLWVFLRQSCHWYVSTLIFMLWLTKHTRFWEYITCWYLLHCTTNLNFSLPFMLLFHLFKTGESESGPTDVD